MTSTWCNFPPDRLTDTAVGGNTAHRPLNSVAAAAASSVAVGVATTHTHTHCSRSHRSGSSSEQPRCLYVSHARSRIKRNGKRQSERGNDSQSFVCQQPRNHRHHRRHRHPLVLRLLLELNPEASFNALFIQGERERERENVPAQRVISLSRLSLPFLVYARQRLHGD